MIDSNQHLLLLLLEFEIFICDSPTKQVIQPTPCALLPPRFSIQVEIPVIALQDNIGLDRLAKLAMQTAILAMELQILNAMLVKVQAICLEAHACLAILLVESVLELPHIAMNALQEDTFSPIIPVLLVILPSKSQLHLEFKAALPHVQAHNFSIGTLAASLLAHLLSSPKLVEAINCVLILVTPLTISIGMEHAMIVALLLMSLLFKVVRTSVNCPVPLGHTTILMEPVPPHAHLLMSHQLLIQSPIV